MDDDDQEDDSENNFDTATGAPIGRMRIAEDPSGFVRLNCEALFKDRFKWSKVAGDFWRVDQI